MMHPNIHSWGSLLRLYGTASTEKRKKVSYLSVDQRYRLTDGVLAILGFPQRAPLWVCLEEFLPQNPFRLMCCCLFWLRTEIDNLNCKNRFCKCPGPFERGISVVCVQIKPQLFIGLKVSTTQNWRKCVFQPARHSKNTLNTTVCILGGNRLLMRFSTNSFVLSPCMPMTKSLFYRLS